MSASTILKGAIKKTFRMRSPVEDITDADLRELNSRVLDYIKSLTAEELENRINSVVCKEPSSEHDENNLSKILEQEGIVIVPEFLDTETAENAKAKLEGIVSRIADEDPKGTGFENEDMLVQSEKPLVEGYASMANHPKSVVSIRQGKDQGMVDVFNVDRLLGEKAGKIRDIYSKKWLIDLLQSYEQAVRPANLNAYINKSITGTRGFHADSYQSTLKGFIYLTDVLSLDDGPYCFVKGSHIDTPWRKANKAIGALTSAATESPFVDPLSVVPVLGKKGTLVLSDQSGIHRGIPQADGALRQLLVMRYL
jgi:hypothetical protein